MLLFALAYGEHSGAHRAARAAALASAAAFGVLIVACRKHYSVDVVVAAYTVPLVWHATRGCFAVGRRGAESAAAGGDGTVQQPLLSKATEPPV